MKVQTDRELLELAAKAAGLLYLHHYEPDNPALLVPKDEDGDAIEWNPLTDDGDALRLAVELDLLWDRDVHYTKYLDLTDRNLLYATRRAIVRAAAALTQGA